MYKIKVYLDINQDAVRRDVLSVLEDSPAIEIIDGVRPDGNIRTDEKSLAIAVLDIGRGDDERIETVRRIREKSPAAVLLIALDGSDDLRYTALRSGASAFLTGDRVNEKLMKAVRELGSGYFPAIRLLLKPAVVAMALNEFQRFYNHKGGASWPAVRLSFQEKTILQYIEKRLTVPQLISNLGFSQKVLVEQLESIRDKLVAIGDITRPLPVPPLEPVPVPSAVPEPAESKIKEPVKVRKPSAGLTAWLKRLPRIKITPSLTEYPQKLYRGIFRPTISKVIILFIIMIIGFFLSIHLLPGHNMYVVSSESMKPTINIGDIIVTRTLDAPSKTGLTPGDIITFEHGKNTVTHRLLSVSGNELTTKGDAAEESDPWRITMSDVKEVYLFRIPYLGYIPQFAKDKIGWFIMIVLPAVVLVALLVKDIVKEALRNEKPATETQGGGVIIKS